MIINNFIPTKDRDDLFQRSHYSVKEDEWTLKPKCGDKLEVFMCLWVLVCVCMCVFVCVLYVCMWVCVCICGYGCVFNQII